MTVLPDNVGRLRGVDELDLLAEELGLGTIPQCDDLTVLLLESDEGGSGHSQRVEVGEQLVDDLVLLAHRIKLLLGDELAALAQG